MSVPTAASSSVKVVERMTGSPVIVVFLYRYTPILGFVSPSYSAGLSATKEECSSSLLIRYGPMTASELVQIVHIRKPAMSKHLHCLLKAGFVQSRRNGMTVTFRIVANHHQLLRIIMNQFPNR